MAKKQRKENPVSHAALDSGADLDSRQEAKALSETLIERFRRLDAKGDAFVARVWARYKRFRLDRAAKSKAYLTHCGKTMTPVQACLKVSIGVVFELLTIVLGIAFLWLNAIFFFVKAERVDLSVFKPNAALWFSDTFAGQSADLSVLRVERKRGSDRLAVIAQDVSISGDDGAQLLSVPYLAVEFDLEALAFGKVSMKTAVIEGGAVTVLRREDDSITAGLGRPETVGRFGPVLGKVKAENTALPIEKQIRFQRWRDIDVIEVRAGQASIIDRVDGVNLTLNDLDLDYKYDGVSILTHARASIVSDDDGSAPFEFKFQSDSDLSSIDIDVRLDDFMPANFTPKRGRFATLSNLDAPVSVRGTIKASGSSIDDINLSVDIGQGRYTDGVTSAPFEQARLRTEYDVEAQALTLSSLELESDKLSFKGQGVLSNIGNLETGFGRSDIDVDLKVQDVKFDAGALFSEPFQFASLIYKGQFNYADRHYTFSELALGFKDASINLSGELQFNDNDIPIELLKLDGRVVGDLPHKALLQYWPKGLAPGTQEFMSERVLAARYDNVLIQTHMVPESFIPDARALNGIVLTNESLRLTFDIRETDVQIIDTMSPLRRARGNGVLLGNQFDLFVEDAVVDDKLTLSNGTVRIPIMVPKGHIFYADFDVTGPVPDMLTFISAPPISVSDKTGIVPSEFSGDGVLNVSIERPLLRDAPADTLKYSVKGRALNTSMPYGVGKHTMSGGAFDIAVDNQGLALSGPVYIGPWLTSFQLNDRFDKGQTPLAINLDGKVSADQLDALGWGLRRYFGGEVDLNISAVGDGLSLSAFDVRADLTQAHLFFQDIWNKPIGGAGQLSGEIMRLPQGGYEVSGLKIAAEGLDIDGEIRVAQDLKLESVFLPQLRIEGLMSGAVAVKRQLGHDFIVALDGTYLNLTPWTRKALSPQSGGVNLPLNVSAEVDTLVLRDNFSLTASQFDYENDGTGIRKGRLIGQYEGEAFSASIARIEGEEARSINIEIPDAGIAMHNFYGLKNIQGGRLSINGTLPPPGMPGGFKGLAVVTEFKLIEAPVFARILSLASLQGLGEILSGDGMNFNSFEAPFEFENGLLSFKDANASGYAVGMTGTGYIDFQGQTAEINGVLVPAYVVNSVLGSVPILGDIVVGRKGEGIFALNYSVIGPFERTQITVNPLSALTPGFLRQIFQPRKQAPLERETVPASDPEFAAPPQE